MKTVTLQLFFLSLSSTKLPCQVQILLLFSGKSGNQSEGILWSYSFPSLGLDMFNCCHESEGRKSNFPHKLCVNITPNDFTHVLFLPQKAIKLQLRSMAKQPCICVCYEHSVAKRPYLSVFLRKFEVFSAVRKRSGKIRKIEKIKKRVHFSFSSIVLTGLHHNQGPCPIKSQRVEYR